MASDAPRRAVFARVGGHPVLDLVNTIQWRLSESRRFDDLVDYDDLVRWAQQVELVSDEEAAELHGAPAASGQEAAVELERVRALREAAYATLYEGAPPAPIVDEYRDAVGRAQLEPQDDHWGWALTAELDLVRHRVALAALDLVTRADLSKLAQCQDAECGWVFLDTSPRHDRRWCVSADCGNRNRVREHYARTRRPQPTAP